MNWLQKTSQETPEELPNMKTYDLRKDGKLIFRGTENECYMKLQRSQSQSWDWAMKYEGWTISPTSEDWRDYYNWYAPE